MKKKQKTSKKSKRNAAPKMFSDKHMKQTGNAIRDGAGLLFSGVMLGATIDIIKKHS